MEVLPIYGPTAADVLSFKSMMLLLKAVVFPDNVYVPTPSAMPSLPPFLLARWHFPSFLAGLREKPRGLSHEFRVRRCGPRTEETVAFFPTIQRIGEYLLESTESTCQFHDETAQLIYRPHFDGMHTELHLEYNSGLLSPPAPEQG